MPQHFAVLPGPEVQTSDASRGRPRHHGAGPMVPTATSSRPALPSGCTDRRAGLLRLQPPSTWAEREKGARDDRHGADAVAVIRCCTGNARGPQDFSWGPPACCALGRIRTCNLLIRSQMLYPLSYECLAFRAFSSRSALREQHYMTCAVTRNPLAPPRLTCGNSVSGLISAMFPRLVPASPDLLGLSRSARLPGDDPRARNGRSPAPGARGFGVERRRRDLNPRWALRPKPH